MRLWLIRHPAPAALPGICYGRLDLPLREPPEPPLSDILARVPVIGGVVTSPAMRCRILADAIAASRGVEAGIDPRWQELDFGAWEGLAWADIPRTLSDPWAANYWETAPPGGETYRSLTERVTAALQDLRSGPDRAIVTHAGPIRAALALAMGRDLTVQPDLPVAFGAILGLDRGRAGWSRC